MRENDTDQVPERSSKSTERYLLMLLVLLGIATFAVLALVENRDRPGPAARQISQTRAARSLDPYARLTTVRNDCGACGTNHPVGGWEAADGRILIFERNGSFAALFPDDSPTSGEWDVTGDQLCLELAIGSRSCFDYEQRVDAMQLDDAIYIRE